MTNTLVFPHRGGRSNYVDVCLDGITRTFIRNPDGTIKATRDVSFAPGIQRQRITDGMFKSMREAACQYFAPKRA